jgi:hypothetical protein
MAATLLLLLAAVALRDRSAGRWPAGDGTRSLVSGPTSMPEQRPRDRASAPASEEPEPYLVEGPDGEGELGPTWDEVAPTVPEPGYVWMEGMLQAGGWTFVNSTFRGLIYDTKGPGVPRFVGAVEADRRAVAVVGATSERAYAVSHNKISGSEATPTPEEEVALVVFDIRDPVRPVALGSLPLRDIPVDSASDGDLVYLLMADGDHGVLQGVLLVVDASAPQSPTLVGELPMTFPHALAVVNGTAYVAVGTDAGPTLLAVDVRRPGSPAVSGSVVLPGLVRDLVVAGDYAYVADGGLRVVDVSSPSSPTVVGGTDLPVDASRVGAAPGAGIVFVSSAGPDAGSGIGFGEVAAVDVASPSSPRVVGRLALDDTVVGLVPRGDALLVALTAGLAVVEARDPRRLAIAVPSDDTRSWIQLIHVEGGHAYTLDQFGRFTVFDVSRPQAPAFMGAYPISVPQDSGAISASDGVAYVAIGDELHVLDVSDPAHVLRVGGLDLFPEPDVEYAPVVAADAAMGASHLFLAALDRTVIVDVVDPARPTVTAEIEAGYAATSVALVGITLYVGDESGSIHAYDVSDAAQPRELARTGAAPGLRALRAEKGRLYAVSATGEISVFDISAPTAILPVAELAPTEFMLVFDAEVRDGIVYVATLGSGVRVFDASGPGEPKALPARLDPVFALDLALSGSSAYLARGNGLGVVDITTPDAPRPVGWLPLPG